MSTQLDPAVEYVRRIAGAKAQSACDADLLGRFVRSRDEAAFTALVRRHAAMVRSVCRRVLHNEHDAEDACQAAFLVLAKRAAAIRKRTSVASWLHGVAYRTAGRQRAKLARNAAVPLEEIATTRDPAADISWREMQTVLDAELRRLPETYRAPLVLCYLEGKTRDEAARELGWRLATLRGRLERGRHRLRRRLEARGLALSAPLLAAMTTSDACGTPAGSIVGDVSRFLDGGSNGEPATELAKELIQTMTISKLKKLCLGSVLFLAVCLPAVFIGLRMNHTAAAQSTTAPRNKPDEPKKNPTIKQRVQKLLPANILVLTNADHGKAIHVHKGQLFVVCLQYPRAGDPNEEVGFGGSISSSPYAVSRWNDKLRKWRTEIEKQLGDDMSVNWFEAAKIGAGDLEIRPRTKTTTGKLSYTWKVKLQVTTPFRHVKVSRRFRIFPVSWHRPPEVRHLKDQEKIDELLELLPPIRQKTDNSARFLFEFEKHNGEKTQMTIANDVGKWSDDSKWTGRVRERKSLPKLRMYLAGLFQDKNEIDLVKLQGVWHFLSEEKNGKPVFHTGIGKERLIIDGTGFALKKGKSVLQQGGLAQLDAGKKPKHLSLMRIFDDGRVLSLPGIYMFKNNDRTLVICLNEQLKPWHSPRPKSFKSDNGMTLLTYTRDDTLKDLKGKPQLPARGKPPAELPAKK